MLLFDLLELLLEAELLPFGLDLQGRYQFVLSQLIEHLRLIDLLLLELRDYFFEADGLEHPFNVFRRVRLLFALLIIIFVFFFLQGDSFLDEVVLGDLMGELFLYDIEVFVLIEYVSQLEASDLVFADQGEHFLHILLVLQELLDDGPCLTFGLVLEESLGGFFASNHVHGSFPEDEFFHAVEGELLLVDVFEVRHPLDASILLELVGKLLQVQPPQPLIDTQVFDLLFNVQQGPRIGNGFLWLVLVFEEVALQLGHVEFELWEVVGEFLALLWALVGVELEEEALHLLLRSVVQLDLHVSPPWPQQGWVQLLPEVGGHDENAALLRADPIQGIQKARKGHMLPPLLLLLDTSSFYEDGVNVFEEDDRLHGGAVKHGVEAVVVHVAAREVQVADVHVHFSCDGLDE